MTPPPCSALTGKGHPCPIPGEWPYRDLLMVCHVHNPDGAYAEQHPTFRARLVAQLDALITGPSPASHTTVRDLEKLAARYISAEKLAVAYRKARDAAIAELATSGVPGDVLAAAAGLTQPRVVQITNAAHGLGRNRRR